MISANPIIEGGLILYMLFGSTSFGYIMLRAGWPNIRSIGIEYKSGVSIIFGIIFSVAAIGISFAAHYSNFSGLSFTELLLANTLILAGVSLVILTVKRKFLGSQKVKVSVPKRVVSANVLAKKAFEKVPEQNYVKTEPQKTVFAKPAVTIVEPVKATPKPAPIPTPTPNPTPMPAFALKFEQRKDVFSKSEVPKPNFFEQKIFEQKKPVVKPAEVKPMENISRDVFLEKQKKADELINLIAKKEEQKQTASIVTRKETEEKTEQQQQFIHENLKEAVETHELEEKKFREKAKAREFAENLPRSTRLLKELLKESEGKLNG
ncbi:MAG TPA: hypothetical protein VFF13_03520 [archaeon]|nr:hypothetical protein [archaeon]